MIFYNSILFYQAKACETEFYGEPLPLDYLKDNIISDPQLIEFENGTTRNPPVSLISRRLPGHFKLNTGNEAKYAEFQTMFGNILDLRIDLDLKEPDSDPQTIIAYKASQFPENAYVLVEDTSLHVQGAEVGSNIKWLLNELESFVGKTATWQVLLAYRQGNQVIIFEGLIKGKIISPMNEKTSFGFDAYFQPEGSHTSLAEFKPPKYNARWQAVKNFFLGESTKAPLQKTWNGKFQSD